MQIILLFLGAALTGLWGISHLIPTRNVVAGFGEISEDNRHIITMEWLMEGIALVFLGVLVVGVTYAGDPQEVTSRLVYILTAGMLVAMAVVSFFTGARTSILPMKLCPF